MPRREEATATTLFYSYGRTRRDAEDGGTSSGDGAEALFDSDATDETETWRVMAKRRRNKCKSAEAGLTGLGWGLRKWASRLRPYLLDDFVRSADLLVFLRVTIRLRCQTCLARRGLCRELLGNVWAVEDPACWCQPSITRRIHELLTQRSLPENAVVETMPGQDGVGRRREEVQTFLVSTT